MSQTIRALVENFVSGLTSIVEEAAESRVRLVLASIGGTATTPQAKMGRPPGSKNKKAIKKVVKTKRKATAPVSKVVKVSAVQKPKKRKKAPKQLCPVPDCKNSAAPVFGMLCKEHKDTPKLEIRMYRKQRKFAKKEGMEFKEVQKNWDELSKAA